MPTEEQIIKALCKVFPEGAYSNRNLKLMFYMYTAGIKYGAELNIDNKMSVWKSPSESKEGMPPVLCYCKTLGHRGWEYFYKILEYDSSFLLRDGEYHEVFIDPEHKELDKPLIQPEYIFHKPGPVVEKWYKHYIYKFV